MIVIIYLEPGIPSNRSSSDCDDYVPAPCTHRPSLLPIEWLSELQGLLQSDVLHLNASGNWIKLDHLEEAKVVTRFP